MKKLIEDTCRRICRIKEAAKGAASARRIREQAELSGGAR